MAEYAGYVASQPVDFGKIGSGLVSNLIAIQEKKAEYDEKRQLALEKQQEKEDLLIDRGNEKIQDQINKEFASTGSQNLQRISSQAVNEGANTAAQLGRLAKVDRKNAHIYNQKAQSLARNIGSLRQTYADYGKGYQEILKLSASQDLDQLGEAMAKVYAQGGDLNGVNATIANDEKVVFYKKDPSTGEVVVMDPEVYTDYNRFVSKKVDYSKAAKSAQDLESGVLMATRRPVVDTPIPDVGIYADERKYANMDPYERALSMLKDIKGSSGISSRGLPNMKGMPTLGTISTDPAMVEAELAEQAKRQIVQEAKRGGLMDGHLGDYSDGGRLLKGPGDGVSDSIPATIGGKQAARLAEGEFVIPARIVSELGNGSTDAGAKRLYAMMDRIKAKRKKAKDIAADTKAYKLLPA